MTDSGQRATETDRDPGQCTGSGGQPGLQPGPDRSGRTQARGQAATEVTTQSGTEPQPGTGLDTGSGAQGGAGAEIHLGGGGRATPESGPGIRGTCRTATRRDDCR